MPENRIVDVELPRNFPLRGDFTQACAEITFWLQGKRIKLPYSPLGLWELPKYFDAFALF